MTTKRIDATISSYSYFHQIGNKDRELSVSIFTTANGKRTATEQLSMEMYSDQIETTQRFNEWLLNFVKSNGEFKTYSKEMVLDMIRMIGVDDEALIYDMYTKLDMSRSTDVAQYFKLINNQNQQQTLFEMLDSSIVPYDKEPIVFKNPANTKQFKFAKGVYPMSPLNYGGTYSIRLFEAPKDTTHFKHVRTFTNNDELYRYIFQNDLTF